MTIEEFVEIISAVSDERRLIANPWRDERRKNHLLQYLRHLERSGVDVMLVGEAPGYRGCALTGIPFTDEVQLKLPANFYALGAWERADGIGNTTERSASAVWAALREYHIIPLMWNAFPFHPYQEGKRASNRTPTQSELKEGLRYLDALRSIFSIRDSQVFAVGKKAKEILGLTSDSHYIRHPANDFKREFRPQFDLKIGKPYGRRPGGTLRHTTGEADAPEAGANGGPSDPENQPVTCRPVMRMPEASRTGPAEKERRMGGTQTWRFQVAGGLVGRKSLPLQEHIDFWPEKGQEWLRGYVVAENTRGTLWGRRIDFHLEVQPFAEPIDLLARPDEPKPGRRPHRRLKDPEKQAYIERVEARLAALRAQFPRPADRALEERCLAHLGNDRLILPMAEAFRVWMDESLETADRCRKAARILGGMKDLFAGVHLPEELLRDDTRVCEGLCKLLGLAWTVEETAGREAVEVDPDLAETLRGLDRLTDEMVEGGRRLWNRPRERTPEEEEACLNRRFDAMYAPAPSLPERLKLLEELWEDPLTDMEDRAEYMERAIEAVRDEGRRKPVAPCPHREMVQQCLETLSRRLDALEREGEAAWQLRAAREMYPACQAWRKDSEPQLPPLSLEAFAAGLRIASLSVRATTDEAGGTHFELGLSFTDRHDSFAGHWITACLEDDTLVSVDLEG